MPHIELNGIKYGAGVGNSQDNALAGVIYPFAGSVVPNGFLMCDGASYLRNDYPELFAVIGTTYGSVDSTHFNVPDLRGRVAIGSSGSHALGTVGGEETHQLSIDEMPAHQHVEPGAWNWMVAKGFNTGDYNAILKDNVNWFDGNATPDNTYIVAGGNGYHNNMQPYTTTNYIISTGKSFAGVPTAGQIDNLEVGKLTVADVAALRELLGINDYIIEDDVDDVWAYKKYASGRAEVYGTVTKTIPGSETWGNLQISLFGDYSLPSWLKRVNSCTYTVSNSGAYTVWPAKLYGSPMSDTNTPAVAILCAGTFPSISVSISYQITGWWRE